MLVMRIAMTSSVARGSSELTRDSLFVTPSDFCCILRPSGFGLRVRAHIFQNKYGDTMTLRRTQRLGAGLIFILWMLPRLFQIPRSPRTLVVLLGNLRCGEAAWDSLNRHVLRVNDADLALVTQRPHPHYQNSTLFQRAKHVWYVDGDWDAGLERMSPGWTTRVLPLLNNSSRLLGGVKGMDGSAAIIFYLRWFFLQKLDEVEAYDRFIVTRNDHYYSCDLDLTQLDPTHIWIPEGENYGGICDRHMVVSSENLRAALNVLQPLLDHPENYRKLLSRKVANGERLLQSTLKRHNLLHSVRRYPRNMFTCGLPHDSTRGALLSADPVTEGVHLKYPKEYELTQITCQCKNLGKACRERLPRPPLP